MSNPLVIWALVCFAAAMVLFLVELFVPSGGLIGLAAGVAGITGIVLLFQVNTLLGLMGAIVCLAALPVLVGFGLKVAPQTPIIRMLTLKSEPRPDADARTLERGDARDAAATSLVGHEGTVVTDLRPVGTCLIDGRRRECLSDTGIIRAGTAIRVVVDDGMQLKVRPVTG